MAARIHVEASHCVSGGGNKSNAEKYLFNPSEYFSSSTKLSPKLHKLVIYSYIFLGKSLIFLPLYIKNLL